MSEDNARIAQLEQRISELSKDLATLREEQISGAMSQGIVTHIAGQIQTLFSNPAMLSGITSAILQNLQNALAFRAGQSKERHPQILVLDYYVPGSQRCTLTDAGQLILEEQLANSTTESEGWEVDQDFDKNQDAVDGIIQLMQSYNAEADKPYYLIDDLSLQAHREDVSTKIAEQNEQRAREQALKNAEV